MTTKTCGQCKAPLPRVAPGEAARCPFCGAEIEDEAFREVVQRLGVNGPLPKGRSLFPLILVVALAAVLAVVIVGVILARRGPDDAAVAPKIAGAEPPQPPPPKDERLPVAELGRADLSSYTELRAAAPPGGFERFDLVASLPWATEIARAWSPDVVIWDLDIRGLKADGTADLSARDDFEATYQFASPARRAAAIQLGAVSERGVPTDLNIEVRAGKVRAEALTPRVSYLVETAKRPPLAPECPLARVVEAALGAGLMRQPFWSAETSYKDEHGWVWVFGSDHDRLVLVGDCAVPEGKPATRR